ncbi:MAG: MASE1 domain-containing protein [Bdellovibrionales bacterium]|nr:MASE1 domain-containing protein [Bdellovibrionales bacterium]
MLFQSRWPNLISRCFLSSAIYYLTGEIGLLFSRTFQEITPFWPPSGLSIALGLVFGFRSLPAIIGGISLLAISHNIPWPNYLFGLLAQVVEFSLAIVINRGLNIKHNSSLTATSFLKVILFTGPIVALISALIGTLPQVLWSHVSLEKWRMAFLLWWLGDGIGILLFAGLFYEIIQMIRNKTQQILLQKNFIILTLFTVPFTLVMFGAGDLFPFQPMSLYLLLPAFAMCAFTFHRKGLAVMLVLTLFSFPLSEQILKNIEPYTLDHVQFFSSICAFCVNFIFLYLLATVAEESLEKDKQMRELFTQISHSHKMSTLGVLSSSIVHEINNPLTVALGNTSLLANRFCKSEKEQLILSKIENHLNRISSIIHSLRKFAVNGAQTEKERVSISQLFSDTKELCATYIRKNDVRLTTYIDQSYPEVQCNSVEIVQVFTNFVKNACEAIASLENRWIVLRSQKSDCGQFMEFLITDSGKGLSQEIFKKMSESFVTTKSHNQGLGLGLSISQQIVSHHGGNIRLNDHSTTTQFIISVPLLEKNKLKQVA